MEFYIHQLVATLMTLLLVGVAGSFFTYIMQKKLQRNQKYFQAEKLKIELLSHAISDVMGIINDCAWWLAEVKQSEFTDLRDHLYEMHQHLRAHRKTMLSRASLFPEIKEILGTSSSNLKSLYLQWASHRFDQSQIQQVVEELWQTNALLQQHHEKALNGMV